MERTTPGVDDVLRQLLGTLETISRQLSRLDDIHAEVQRLSQTLDIAVDALVGEDTATPLTLAVDNTRPFDPRLESRLTCAGSPAGDSGIDSI